MAYLPEITETTLHYPNGIQACGSHGLKLIKELIDFSDWI
jgi:hypothetical protein